MKYIVKDKQLQVLGNHIQSLIDSTLTMLWEETENMGLGEMDEIDEIKSINDITIDRIVPYLGTIVYVDIRTDSNREEFDNVMAELNYRLQEWIPNIKLFLNEINPE
jgi:hypothetical protein